MKYGPLILCALALLVVCIESCKDECSHNKDCAGAGGGGKGCGPRDAWCESGTCQFMCDEVCQTVASDTNACSEGICNESAQSLPGQAHCTVLPISCTTPSDCPLYRPADSSGAQQDWACDQGTCTYAGLMYVKGQL